MPAQQTCPHEAALAIGLFQEGESVVDFQEGDFLEGGSDPFVDLINELEFLDLGADYVDDIDRMVDVTEGIAAAADGEALLPSGIWESDSLCSNICLMTSRAILTGKITTRTMRTMRTMRMGRWHSLIPPVTNSRMDTAWRRKNKHTEGSCHDLLSLPCLIVNRGGGYDYGV